MSEGRTLGGRYELGAELGFGGMAEVFLGRDVRLGREVAVKVLRPELARDPSFLQRFRREAQSAAGLNQPNIVGVYDTGEEDGTPYIVMEYVAGRTLREVLIDDGRLLPRRALEIISEVCAALEYSHRAGIVHRDIKPANVMLTQTGEVKVMDFGIARAASDSSSTMTQTATILGTAQYLSPEQARGEHVDARSDVYSTGCMLYELLTGTPPFQGDSPVSVAYQHVREDPVPPSMIDPELPASLDAVVLKAMAKNPVNRYQSAADFKADVDRAIAGRAVTATPVLAGAPTTALPAASSTTVLLRPDRDEHRARRGLVYTSLFLAVLIVFVVAALLAKHLFSDTKPSLTSPTLIGLTLPKAEAQIEADGLKVGTPITYSYEGQDGNNSPAGTVYNQSPLNGFSIRPGSLIDLFVSKGIEEVQVPAVSGLSLADATTLLANAHLSIGTVNRENVAGTASTVLSVSPKAGTTLTAGQSVTLTIVSGQQEVPDVLNEQYAEALQTLQAAGFQVASPTMTADSSAAGTVIAEDPQGGAIENTGTTIVLTVSTGPASPSPTSSGSGSPSTSPSATTSTSTTPTPTTTSTTGNLTTGQ